MKDYGLENYIKDNKLQKQISAKDQKVINDYLDRHNRLIEFEDKNYPIVCECVKCKKIIGKDNSMGNKFLSAVAVPQQIAEQLNDHKFTCPYCNKDMVLKKQEKLMHINGTDRYAFFLIERSL